MIFHIDFKIYCKGYSGHSKSKFKRERIDDKIMDVNQLYKFIEESWSSMYHPECGNRGSWGEWNFVLNQKI